ncbi:hypothetical protein Xekj_03880 [Xenorhabdus sp. KJ12.1]|nr:hypothetical protein Xekj_04194 [Xenorhabdus sp. KJ12.1]PHM67336.1 hypothetical protein Xekj_03880 [Xenorhabdus sp. KJ12.1]
MRLVANHKNKKKASLTRKQAADFIGINVDTLSHWCAIGKIAYNKKDPARPRSPYLFTYAACIAALNNSIQTVPVSTVDVAEKGDKKCQSSVEEIHGTGTTRHQAAKELRNRLEQRTRGKLRNCTIEERPNYGA